MGHIVRIQATPILPGATAGRILAADVPLSFWGGFDPATGDIIDRRHPLFGQNARGRILILPAGRGSCSGSGVLLEAIRNGTAPAAIITARIDPIISLGAILGDELYGKRPALLRIAETERRRLKTGGWLSVAQDGRMTITG